MAFLFPKFLLRSLPFCEKSQRLNWEIGAIRQTHFDLSKSGLDPGLRAKFQAQKSVVHGR